MTLRRKAIFWIFPYLLFAGVVIDARMPNCDSSQDKCQCHSSFTEYRDAADNQPSICLKVFHEKMNRDSASRTCAKEFSNLMYRVLPDTVFRHFGIRGVRRIWFGMRESQGFYIAETPGEVTVNSLVFKKLLLSRPSDESYLKNGCIAMDPFSAGLIYENCSMEHEFVCANFGFPVYPVSNSLACPKGWLLFYHLPMEKSHCIKPFIIRARDLDVTNETATCMELGSEVADLGDFKDLFNYMIEFNITGYGLTDYGSDCETRYIEAVFGDHFKEKVTCLDKIFICQRSLRKISLKPKVSPDFSDSDESENMERTILTCEVPLRTRNFSKIEPQLHYIWYKDDKPITLDSQILNLSSYPAPLEALSKVPQSRQGTYSCVVEVEGIADRFPSQNINYFHSDVITFVVYARADLKTLQNEDDKEKYLLNVRKYLNETLADVKDEFPWRFRSFDWDHELFRIDKEEVWVAIRLYFWSMVFDETKLYLEMKRLFKENPFMNSSLELEPAAYCFDQAIPSSGTAFDVSFLWKGTTQTRAAVSEPLCLNDWRLITRKCSPNSIYGARWGRIDISKCTKYQNPNKELKVKCTENFKYSDTNICMAIHKEHKTFREAEETCQKLSSILVDPELLNRRNVFENLGHLTGFWISNRRKLRDQTKEHWIENNTTITRRNRNHLCASRTKHSNNFLSMECDSFGKNPFACIYQPILLLNTFIFSKPWYRYSDTHASYYFERSARSWPEASKYCSGLRAKSTLLQSIRNSEDYSVFKVFLRQLFQESEDSSWWMNLFQNGDSLKWQTTPEESPTFVDWERHTDFYMNQSAGVLHMRKDIYWSLMDTSSKYDFICETQDLKDNLVTAVYIEDRTKVQEAEFVGAFEKDLKCVPSGWFVWNSIVWYKDGVAISTEPSQRDLQLSLKAPFKLESVSEFQGYYSCSVDLDHSKQVYSSEVLVKFLRLHTFVLHMKSKVPDSSYCSDFTTVELPFIKEFNKYLEGIYGIESRLFLKDVACSESVINSYHHFYILKDKRTEKELHRFLELSINSGNGTFLESYKRLNIDKEDIIVKSTVSCPKEMSHFNGHNLNWPETPIGESTLPDEMCVTEEGSALERKCLGDFNLGAHWSSVDKDCADVQSKVTLTLYKLAKTNIIEDNILSSLRHMARLVTTSKDINAADVQYVAQILRNAANVPAPEPHVFRAIVQTVDALIELIPSSENRDIMSNVPSRISSAVDNIALNADQLVKICGANIALSVLPLVSIPRGAVLENWGANVTLFFNGSDENPEEQLKQLENFEAAVLLPENVITEKLNDNETNLAIVVRRNYQFLENVEVISPVVDVTIGSESVYDMDPPVELIFKVTEMRDKKDVWGCVSWDKALNNKFGGWSYKGCYTVVTNSTHVRCQCDHLTSFAVLMEITPEIETPKIHKIVLSIITYIGCFLSISGLGTVIITFAVFKKWRSDIRHKILFNFSLSLLSLLVIFLIGIKRTGWVCFVVATLLHYFMLASFSWMVVEAFLHYQCLVKVIGTYIPNFLQKAMVFAWGLPFIIVVAAWGAKYNSYQTRSEFCWLTGDVFNFAVALPVSTLLAINFVIFGVILYSVTRGRLKETLRNNQSGKKDLINRAKAMFCVSVILGLSWVFGLLTAVEETKISFQYLFVITTTLQGFLISVFFVFRQKNTRVLWQNLAKTTSSSNSSQPIGLKSLDKLPSASSTVQSKDYS